MEEAERAPADGRRVAQNTLVNGTHIVLSILVTIPLTPFLLGELGAGPYGIYVLASSFAGLGGFLGLGELGFQGAVVRYVAKYAAEGNVANVRAVVATTFTIFLGLGALAAAAILTFTEFGLIGVFNIESSLQGPAKFVFAMLAIQTVGEYASLSLVGYLEGMQRYPTVAVLSLGQLLAFICGAVTSVLLGAGVEGVAGAAAGAAVLHAVAASLTARVQPGRLRLRVGIDRAVLPELTQYSWRLILIRLTSIAYDQMDKVIIGIALSPVSLATYDIANKLHLFARYGLSVTSSAVTPAASSLSAVEDRARLRALLVLGTRATVAVTVPLCVTVILLAAPLIEAWVGDGYPEAAPAAQLFLAYVLFTSVTTVGVTMLIGMGLLDRFVLLGFASMLVNLVVSIALVRPLGIQGVVIGTTVGYALITGPYLVLILRPFAMAARTFFGEALAGPVGLGVVYTGLLAGAITIHRPDSTPETIAYATGGVIGYAVAYVALVARGDERALLRSLVPH